MTTTTVEWAKAALAPTVHNRVSLLMDWRRHLYQEDWDKSQVALSLRQSDESNTVLDINAIDCSDELADGQIMALLSFWMFHGRSQNIHGGSTWLSIRSISLSGSNLSHTIMELFFQGLHGSTSLTNLDVSANQIGGYSNEDDFFIPVLSPGQALQSLIKDNRSLISLRASYCNLGMNSIHGLATTLNTCNRNLTALDISANSLWWDEVHVDELDSDRCFNTTAMMEIANMMQKNHVLQNVVVSAAKFKPHRLCGRKVYTPSSSEIEDERDNLSRISFGIGGNMGARASRSDLVIAMECLKSNHSITALSLSGLRVDHEAAESVASLIEHLPVKLTEINLTKVQTSMKTSEMLAEVVLYNIRQQWKEHDENMEKERKKEQRRTGFVKQTPTGCDYDWNAPGENGFQIVVPEQTQSSRDEGREGQELAQGEQAQGEQAQQQQQIQILRVFSDVPVLRLCGGGTRAVLRLSLKGAGIGLHGAIVLGELLKRSNTVTHLYLSENNIGTKGCMVIGDAVFGVSRSVVFVDLRQNGIENKAMDHCGKVLRDRLDRGSTGELGGNRPLPPIVTFDVQKNVIGGFGVSAQLPGLNDFLDTMSDMAERRETANKIERRETKAKDIPPSSVTIYLSGNQIRPTMAREMLAKHANTRLKVYVDVRQ